MRKSLKLVKERKEDIATENNLRGFGRDPIFENSAPFAVLTVQGLTLEETLTVREHYNLIVKNSDSKKTHCLTCKNIVDGEHKLQAMTLFVAALSLSSQHSHASFHLHEMSSFKEHLNPRHQKESVNQKNHTVMLSPTVQHHLAKAGFSVQVSNENQLLDHRQITSFIREFRSQKQHVIQHQKKAG